MPLPLLAAAAPAIAGVINNQQNAASTMHANLQNQQFSAHMYDRQRKDSIEFWNMQNVYNSPEQQMARFKAAGLNPNLIYGQGNSGNAGTISTPDVTPVDFRAPKFERPDIDPMAILLAQADLRIKGAQFDNLTVQNEVIRQDAMLRRLQAERTGFDLGLEQQYGADFKREGLRQLSTSTDLSVNRDAREAAQNASNVQEAAERMLTMKSERTMIPYRKGQMSADADRARQNIKTAIQEGVMRQFEIQLREHNITFNDPLWARYVAKFLDKVAAAGPTGIPAVDGKRLWDWFMNN